MAWGKKVLISPYRPDDLLSPASSTVSTYRRDTDNSKDANRLAAYPSDGAEPPFQGGAEPWSTAEASFAASDEGAEARPPSPASPDETSSARGSPFQQQWHEHLAGGTSHEGSVASTPLRGPWKDFVSSSAASEVSSVLSTDARSSMIGAAGPALLPGQLPGPVPPYTSSSSPLAKEASQPLPEGPLGTPPREEASRDFEEQTGSATPRDPTNGSHSPMAGGASLQADSGRMSEGQVPATVDGDGGSRWGQGGASPEPVPAQAPEPQGTGPGKPLKSRAGAEQDKLLYGNTAAALANSSSPWEAAILQQKLAVRIAARKAEKSAAAGTPPVRRPAMLAELDRAMAEARKGLIQAREGSTGAGEEGEHAEGALTPGGRSRDTKAQEEVLSDQATPSRGSLGDASPGAHRGADASQSPSPRQDKAGNGEFRSPSLPGTGERREPLDIPLRKSSSVDNPSSAKKRITFGQGAPPRRRLVRSVTEGASAKGRNKEGDPGLSAGHGSGGSSSALASVAEEDGGLTGNAVRRSSSNASPGPRLMGMALQRSASAAPGKVGSSSGRRGGAAMERIESSKHNRSTSLESPTPLLSSLEHSGSMRRHLFSGLGGREPRSAAPPVVDLSARGRVMMAAGIPPSATAHSSGAPESPLRLPSIPGSPLLRAKSAMHSPLPRGKSAPAGAGQEAAGSPPQFASPGAGCLLPSKSSKGSASQRTPRAASSKGTVKGPSLPEASSTAPRPVKGPVKGPAKGGLPRGSRDGAIPERSLSVPARAAQRKTKEKKLMNEGNGELPRLCSEASEGSGSSDSMVRAPHGAAQGATMHCFQVCVQCAAQQMWIHSS